MLVQKWMDFAPSKSLEGRLFRGIARVFISLAKYTRVGTEMVTELSRLANNVCICVGNKFMSRERSVAVMTLLL